ncbi:hypothetical protein [Leucobacter soli]|uniref:hypothetical protein n=1 Tax=Leucobacter soli TaxID=2812850 RepID=UPI00360E4E06
MRVLYRLPDRIASRRTRPELLEQTRRGILNWWTARCADFTRLWFGPREIEEFDEIERDLPTLEMLVDTAGAATSRADGADLMRVVCALWPLFTARNRVKQALAWIDAIAEHAELDRATEFDKNWTIAWLALGGNDISGSEEALGSVQASDAVEEARLAQVRGIRELYADNAAESIRLLALACEGHRRAGDTAAQQFIAESHLAAAYWRAGRSSARRRCAPARWRSATRAVRCGCARSRSGRPVSSPGAAGTAPPRAVTRWRASARRSTTATSTSRRSVSSSSSGSRRRRGGRARGEAQGRRPIARARLRRARALLGDLGTGG